MKLRVIIPLRSLKTCKSRLRDELGPPARRALVHAMARHVIRTALQVTAVDAVAVLSRDPEVLEFAREEGATALVEQGPPDLNQALELARLEPFCQAADALLILFGDLPALSANDIHQMLIIAGAGPKVVIAPDRHGSGTNALLLQPRNALSFQFGLDSCRLHRRAAEQAGHLCELYLRWGTAFDVDEPRDLEMLQLASAVLGGRTDGHIPANKSEDSCIYVD